MVGGFLIQKIGTQRNEARDIEMFREYERGGITQKALADKYGLSLEMARCAILKGQRYVLHKSNAEKLREKHKDDLRSMPIEGLLLTTRASHCLYYCGIKTVGELLDYGGADVWQREIMRQPNLGLKTVLEIEQRLTEIGITL